MMEYDQVEIQKRFLRPLEMAFWVGIFGIQALSWFIPFSSAERTQVILLTGASSLFVLLLFHWIPSRFGLRPWVFHLGMMGAIGMVARHVCLFKPHGVNLEIVYMAVVAGVGMVVGRRMAIYTAILAVLVDITSNVLRQPLSTGLFANLGLQILALLLTGYTVGVFTGMIREKATQSNRQNRYLSTLLQVGVLTSEPEDLSSTLSRVAEMVARSVPVSSCQIWLLRGDQLVIYGAYPIRPLEGWDVEIGQSYPVSAFPGLQRVFNGGGEHREGEYLILRHDHASAPLEEGHWETPGGWAGLFFDGVQTVCVFPLITQDIRLGLITVGEVRRWEREPFTQDKLGLLQTVSTQVAAAIYNAQLFHESQHQAERLSVLNKVMQAIGSTIELDDLLELIYEQLNTVIPSDSYFVSLYDPDEDVSDLRILIDDGRRFPPARIPSRKGLAGWVIRNRQPLLVHHLSEEIEDLPTKPLKLGQDRMSESWLGIPMLVGERFLGILAIASYTPHAFSEDDVTLLTSLAFQAALAVDNARQHAEVKVQARRDSLTGAYNHGHLLLMLDEEVQRGRELGTPVSLIMLDVDYFKAYNDQYGHVIGDKVLCQLVQAIQAHVRDTDIVGRWGGEEFAVGLPGSTKEQALQVAYGIRASLAQVALRSDNGSPTPSPTVSQGIATFPQDANDTAELVNVADATLYKAKETGRDQIVVANGGP